MQRRSHDQDGGVHALVPRLVHSRKEGCWGDRLQRCGQRRQHRHALRLADHRHLYAPNREFVGVAGLDANLLNLEQVLTSMPLGQAGLAYVFDEEGYVLTHPLWDESTGSKKVRVADVAARTRTSAASTSRAWSSPGREGRRAGGTTCGADTDTGKSETWFYSFPPAPGAPCVLVLTTVDRDIYRKAVDLEGALNFLDIHTTVTVVVFALGAALLLAISYWFQVGFVRPVKDFRDKLLKAERKNYTVQSTMGLASYSNCAKELGTAHNNFNQMLVALRFGNPNYYKSNKTLEYWSIVDAKALVERTGNKRGIGVCLSNLGNFVRQEAAKGAKGYQDLEAGADNAEELLSQAVDNARELVQAGTPDVTEDVIGQRLLGLALAQYGAGKAKNGDRGLQEAVAIHTRTGSWPQLARLASAACTCELPASGKELVLGAAKTSLDLARKAAAQGGLQAQEGTALAQACVALSQLQGDPAYALWALNSL